MGVQITSGPRTQHCSVCIGKSIGCHTVSPTTLKHIRKTCNIQRDDSEQNWAIFETKSFIICDFLCLFIAAISISCVVHASLSVPDWEDRSSSPQSSQPPSLPTRVSHNTHFFELSYCLLTSHAMGFMGPQKNFQRYRP